MKTVCISQVRVRLSELVNEVKDGGTFTITRGAEPVARLVPVAKKVDVEMLRKITEGFPIQEQSAGDFIREMRDSDRY